MASVEATGKPTKPAIKMSILVKTSPTKFLTKTFEAASIRCAEMAEPSTARQ